MFFEASIDLLGAVKGETMGKEWVAKLLACRMLNRKLSFSKNHFPYPYEGYAPAADYTCILLVNCCHHFFGDGDRKPWCHNFF